MSTSVKTKTRRLVVGLAALTLGGIVWQGCADPARRGPRAVERQAPVDVAVLPNGLSVITQADERPLSAVWMSVHAGTADEPQGKRELAHLVEHLACVSNSASRRDWLEALFELGAIRSNALTELDQTSYFAVVPSHNVGAVLTLYEQLLRKPLASVDVSLFERERRIVQNEGWLRDDWQMPAAVLTELQRLLFSADHPYGNELRASSSTDDQLTLEDARRFAAAHYHPSNATISVVGGVDANARAKLNALGVGSAASPKVTQAPVQWHKDLPPGPKLVKLALPHQTHRLWFAWTLPPDSEHLNHDALVLASMANEFLRRPTSEGDRHLAVTDAWVTATANRHASLLIGMVEMTANADAEKVLSWIAVQVRRAMFDHLYVVKNHLRYDVDAIEASVGLAHAAWGIALENPLNRAANLTSIVSNGLDPLRLFQNLDDLGGRDASDLRAFANTWLTSERLRGVHVVQAEALPPDRTTSNALPLESAWSDTTGHGERNVPEPTTANAALGTHSVVAPQTSKVSSGELENGLSYVFFDWPNAGAPVVMLGYDVGSADARSAEIGLATQLAMVRETWLDAGPLGIDFRRYWRADSSVAFAQSPSTDVVSLAGFLLDAKRDESPHWPNHPYFSREAPRLPLPPFMYARTRLLGDHPWGKSPNVDALVQVSGTDVVSHFSRAFDPSNTLLVAVGDFSNTRAARTILDKAKTLVARPQAPREELLATSLWSASNDVYFEALNTTTQTAQFGCILPPQTKPALTRVLERAVKRVLFSDLRQERALSYSVDSTIESFRGSPTLLWAQADLPTQRLAEAFLVWRKFRSQPAAEILSPRLAAARLEALSEITHLGLTSENTAFALFDAWRSGQTFESVEALPSAIRDTADADVLAAFEYCREHSILTFYGDSERLEKLWSRER